jgi:purine-binding chemotaxis protein CheW
MADKTVEAVLEEDVEIEQDQYLVFITEGQEFGIPANQVQEISTVVPVTRVPNTPAHVDGIMNLRGRLASVLNFRKKFAFDNCPDGEDTRIIIIEYDAFPIGIKVDSVAEVIRIPDEAVQRLPESAAAKGVSDEYIHGVGMLDKRIIILLNMGSILAKKEFINPDLMKKAMEAVKEASISGEAEAGKTKITATKAEKKMVKGSVK